MSFLPQILRSTGSADQELRLSTVMKELDTIQIAPDIQQRPEVISTLRDDTFVVPSSRYTNF